MNHKVETGIAPTKLVNAAIKLYYDGKIDDLFIRLSNLIKTYPNTYIFYNILGSIYFHKRLYTEAEKCFLKTIDLKPNHPYAYNNLGNLFMEISRIKEAEENLKYAIKLNNKYYEAYNNLGKLLQDTNRLEDSETNLRKALEIKGDVAATHYLLGITLFNLNKYEEAKLSFEQAIFLENNNSDYFNCLGMVFIKQKKIDEALQNYEKALELNCNNYRAQLNIGNVFFELGKFKSAKQSFRRALKINPDSPEINLSLAIFFDYFNDLVSASNYCKRTIERSKNEKGLIAAVNLAIIEYLKFNFSETKKYLKQSFEIIQKKTPLYKDAKVYHYYLTKLTDININQGRKIIPKISEKNLYVIGESHSLESHGLNINIKGEDFFCRSLLIIGCMQWDLGNKSRNKYKIKFEKVFFKLPKYSSILLAIGEIDCRIDSGILKYCGKFKKKKVNEVVTETVENYLNYIEKCNKSRNHKIYLQGVPSPMIVSNCFTKDEVINQIQIIKYLNNELKVQSKRRGFDFLDVYKLTNRGDGISNEVWHIDNFHISPEGILEAWKNFNIEN